jgi:hypothetical protein
MKLRTKDILTSNSAWAVCQVLHHIEYPIYMNLIAELAEVPPPIAFRTLSQLVDQNIVVVRTVANKKCYKLNNKHSAYHELDSVFEALQKANKNKQPLYQTIRTLDEVCSFNDNVRAFINDSTVKYVSSLERI